jgi:hypothetical protein
MTTMILMFIYILPNMLNEQHTWSAVLFSLVILNMFYDKRGVKQSYIYFSGIFTGLYTGPDHQGSAPSFQFFVAKTLPLSGLDFTQFLLPAETI